LAEVLDFFSVQDPATGVMGLNMSQQSWGPNIWPVAQGVTRFEVRYAIDTQDTPQGKIGTCPTCTEDPYGGSLGSTYAWCRDLRSPAEGGNCALTTTAFQPITANEMYNRIIAMHVTFDLTRTVRPGGSLGYVFSGTQKTSTYQTLVVFRNMQPS